MANVKYGCMLDTDKLKSERNKRKWSMAKAAKLSKMGTPQAWDKIENGDGLSLTLKTLNKIASAFKMPAKELLK